MWISRELQLPSCAHLVCSGVAALAVALAGCGDEPTDSRKALPEAVRTGIVGQWQGRSEDGRLVVNLSYSSEGTYDWKQSIRGTPTPLLAHTGRWEPQGEVPADGSTFTLIFHCETIHFGSGGSLKPGDHTVSLEKLPDGVSYRAETPWGVFILEHVPEA